MSPAPPRILPRFFKAHGHGNDYLVFEEEAEVAGAPLTPGLVRRICDRHRGVGADGIVVVEAPGEGAEIRLRMFNPDGGEFERSGNGLRIAGVYLRRLGRVGEGWFPVTVGGDRVRVRVPGRGRGGVWAASAEMGRVGFPDGPPFVAPGRVDGRGRVTFGLPSPDGAGEVRLRAVPVSVGNPHAVVFGPRRSRAEVEHYGRLIGEDAAFPQGANVQFAEMPVGGREIRARIRERGVGWTSASGTSACAVVAAAVKTGLVPRGRVAVRMEGGEMGVELDEEWSVRLHGPVEEVCEGVLAGRYLD